MGDAGRAVVVDERQVEGADREADLAAGRAIESGVSDRVAPASATPRAAACVGPV